MSSRLGFFKSLIFVGRWQPRDPSQKAAVMAKEEEGSNNIGCSYSVTSWLQVASVVARIAAGSFLPQGSLLAMIKEDGSKRSLLAMLGSERCMLRLKG
ncbi:hypothetical protein BHE74_00053773 [Ensete ventricosum]|nr:hypothetical protein BHE74_00053773 [Ensete ventricosum]